jgi:hypothetical protein
MAWNDPGKNENPWKRKPEQGPPDLDEVLRRFQKKLRSLFGGGGPRPVGGGSSGGSAAFGIGYVVAGLVAIWLVLGSWYLNEAAERSVITRFGKYVKTTGAGFNLRLPWPIDRRTVVNVTEFRSFSDRTRMLTQDEALVDINLAVQYRRADPVKFTFNVRDPEETLGESAKRDPRGHRAEQARLRARSGPAGDQRQDQGPRAAHDRRLQHGHRDHQRQPAGRQRAGAGRAGAEGCHQGARGQGARHALGRDLRERHRPEGARPAVSVVRARSPTRRG